MRKVVLYTLMSLDVTAASRLRGRCSKLGLVDELRLVVGPACGFGGRRLFDALDRARELELLSATAAPSGSMLIAYGVPGGRGASVVRSKSSAS